MKFIVFCNKKNKHVMIMTCKYETYKSVHILARQGMVAIASSYGFKEGTSAF